MELLQGMALLLVAGGGYSAPRHAMASDQYVAASVCMHQQY